MDDLLNEFLRITKYDLRVFFEGYVDFVGNNYQNFIEYYSGEAEIDRESIDKLASLRAEAIRIDELFNIHSRNLTATTEFWDLLERFEDVSIKLDTIFNTPKWLRSNLTAGVYEPNVNFTRVLKQNETFEDVADSLGFEDPDNDWVSLALKNDINEEKYTASGGRILSVSLQNNSTVNVRSVVDSIVGKRIYGADIQKKIEFTRGDDGDLVFLNNDETINQAFSILLGINRGGVPEFPQDGIDKRAFVGVNFNSISFPSIFRQLVQLFNKDDTFNSLNIVNVTQQLDSTIIEVSAETKLGETITGELIV